MNAKTIKGVFFFLLVPLCFVWSIDTIRCYSGVYTSNTNAYFSNTEYTTSFGTAYAAKLGTLVITVDHSKGKNAGDNEDYSTYIHSLYFRNSTESNSISLNSDSYTFTADLCAVLTTRVNPTTYAPVDIAEQTLVTVQGSNETVLNILPEEFLTGNGIVSPTENGEVLQVDFYLKRTGTTPSDNDLTGHAYTVVANSGAISSISALCVMHNYSVSQGNVTHSGSVLINYLDGDLSFFPSNHYNKSIPYGVQPESGTTLCWMTFDTSKSAFDLPENTTSVLDLSTASVLLYGDATVSNGATYAINYQITSTSGDFTMHRVKSDSTLDPNNYLPYSVLFIQGTTVKQPVVYGQTYSWSGLQYGSGHGAQNSAVLAVTGIDKNASTAHIGGKYRDTIIITIIAADAVPTNP